MSGTRTLNARHAAVEGLSELFPEGAVVGGSFSHWLPHPANLPHSERGRIFVEAQRAATELCLVDLLHVVGLPAIEMGNRPGGDQAWPAGIVGSLSQKGAVVAGAIAKTSVVAAIGIDV